MQNKYGSEGFVVTNLDFSRTGDFSLQHAVEMLPARVKQAFYGAAVRNGVIHRGTWNGCAFNAGGIEVGNELVNSYQAASKVFDVSQALVKRFIQAWDGSPYPDDQTATHELVRMLEEVGIFSEPNSPTVEAKDRRKRIVTQTLYEGNMTEAQVMEQFKHDLTTEVVFDAELEVMMMDAEALLMGAGSA